MILGIRMIVLIILEFICFFSLILTISVQAKYAEESDLVFEKVVNHQKSVGSDLVRDPHLA
jgi:hypothetical protein